MPPGVETVYEVEVQVDDETVSFLGGVYTVDPMLEGALLDAPQLGDVVIERVGEGVIGTAAVLPASDGPEALLLWFGDDRLREVTVSTQGRPDVGWVPGDFGDVCLGVDEIGLLGDRVSSEDRCVDLEASSGCGCSSARSSVGMSSLVLPYVLMVFPLLSWRRRDSGRGLSQGRP